MQLQNRLWVIALKNNIELYEKVNKWEDEQMDNGVELTKFYFSLSKDQQEIRMKARKNSELKYWKLSKMMKKS